MLPVSVPERAEAARPWAELHLIGPPPNHRDIPTLEDCGTLAALVENVPGEPRRIRSYWRPSPEELEALNAGEPIELCVVYPAMVPVSINVP